VDGGLLLLSLLLHHQLVPTFLKSNHRRLDLLQLQLIVTLLQHQQLLQEGTHPDMDSKSTVLLHHDLVRNRQVQIFVI
jgi:hypothetical protein